MFYIVLSIICSVSVGALLKFSKRYSFDIIQVIAVNYILALGLCYITFRPDVSVVNSSSPWKIYIGLAILLPSVFLLLASSIKHIGIVKTDIAQRLSLFIPILAAYFIFKENFTTLKLMGLIVGFPAIFLTLSKKQSDTQENRWIFPVLVLLGFGIIDILFKQIALEKSIPYTTSLFIVFFGALVLALCFTIYSVFVKKNPIQWKNIIIGSFLGILNFGNILFYLKAHKAFSENPSTVFAAMNLGVIVLGSLVGIIAFKEKVTLKNYIGIVLALGSIVLITLSQIQAK
ncbi:DMT family transporter [Flavobacterium lindanitolerans]|uniref:EamA-like transporter family protein n=1 Tax=Flavobacterium lindanitolerans TaxID=428988 RepID=A0A497U539_9FLAO|nr:DMT family transporter [Flavobacterium lindanitolerans]PKW20542.1 EamA-like transporter family protein [Flavobacterium lindanitolerans]RLJ23985.1 EamA-like transporter family protein [Flavobacterium lindanitolerans]